MLATCQESDKVSDYESDLPIILAQRNFNHVELQVIISLQCFGMIPAIKNCTGWTAGKPGGKRRKQTSICSIGRNWSTRLNSIIS